jgi:4-hydroxy-2,2'-bipyrrole-5-carbaldehyde O-methyltransferase
VCFPLTFCILMIDKNPNPSHILYKVYAMIIQTVKNLLRAKDKYAHLKALALMKPMGGLIFYHTAIQTGLMKMLTKPSTIEQISVELNITNRQLLTSLLDLGCSLKELTCSNGKYRIKGKMARALSQDSPVADLIRETVQYHTDVAHRLDSYLLGNTKGDYLDDLGGIIAGSSRFAETLIKSFIYHTIKKSETFTILEFGCGSGAYLKYYVDRNSANRGIAIDRDASAVAIARENVKRNNIEKNFTVLQDNIMKPASLKNGSFDLITSYSNIYYFSDEERSRLFESIIKLLKDGGRFMLATMFKSKKLTSAYYDIIFSATQGLYPLPNIDDIVGDLKKAGFSRVSTVNLLDDSFKGVVAVK